MQMTWINIIAVEWMKPGTHPDHDSSYRLLLLVCVRAFARLFVYAFNNDKM